MAEVNDEASSFWDPLEQLQATGLGVALQDLPDCRYGQAQVHFQVRLLSKVWHQWKCITLAQQICDAWSKIGVSKSMSEV